MVKHRLVLIHSRTFSMTKTTGVRHASLVTRELQNIHERVREMLIQLLINMDTCTENKIYSNIFEFYYNTRMATPEHKNP